MKRFLLSILFFVGVVSFGFGQSVGDFQTRQSGDWNDSNTWEEWDGASWVNTANTPTNTSGVISILNTHSVTVTANITVDQTFVRSGGQVTVNSGVTMSINYGLGDDFTIENSALVVNNGSITILTFGFSSAGLIRVYGSLENNNFINNTRTSRLYFETGSEYDHVQEGGTIPTATWASDAVCRISNISSAVPSGFSNQNFGHLIWETPALNNGQTYLDLGTVNSIYDLTINDTNSDYLVLSEGNPATIPITNNFTVNNSAFIAVTETGDVTVSIGNDFNYSSTSPSLLAVVGTCTIEIGGDFNFTGGDLSNFEGTAEANFIFDGGIEQFYTGSSSYGASGADNINFVISNGSRLVVNGQNASFAGSGNFSLGASSTLAFSNTNGISSGTSSGVIRVSGTRTYNTGSTIEYNGTTTQSLGDGFPASGVNLTINNTGSDGNNLVNMSSDITISSGRTLTLTDGALNIGDGNLLTLNGAVTSTSNGGLAGTSLSNLTIGGTGAFGTLGFVGTAELNNFTLNRTSSGSVTLGGDLTIVGNTDPSDGFTQTAGDLLLNGNNLTLSGNYEQTGGTLISNSTSSLIINGSGALPAGLSFSGDVNAITLDRASTTLNTAASAFTATNLNLYSGTLDGSAISIADGGTLERRTNGVLANALTAVGSYNLIYDHSTALNTGAELPNSATVINNIEKRGTGVLTVQNDFTVNGTLTFANGSFNAGTNIISLNGDLIANAASTLSNSTITFDGNTTLSGGTPPTFGSITVNGTFNPTSNFNVNGDIINNGTLNSSAGTLTINSTSQLSGSNPITVNNFTIGASGNVTASASQALEINGNFTNNGSFTANGGTVNFVGNTTISGTVPDFANIQVEGIFNAPSTLNLSGSLTNNGTFNDGNGIINMTGGSARAIAGTSAFNIHTLNLSGSTVSNNNTGGVSIEDGITLAANTIFDADGGGAGITTLLSTSSTEAAYVGQIPSTSSVTGNITVQRYFSTGRFWRYLGSPVTNTTVADWQEEFPITGSFSDPSSGTFDGVTLNSSVASLYYYDAAGSAYVAYPSSGTAASNSIVNGRGYSPFIRNNTANVIAAVTGTLQQQAATLPVAHNGDPAESWNLVANPYAAPIDWDAAGWTRTNVANEVHVPKTDGSFATYINGSASNGGSQYIASGQAFWVRTTAASPSLETTEAVKSIAQNPTYQRTEPLELFRIKMIHAGLSDEIVFALRDRATFGYDEAFDANRRLNISGFGYTLSTTGDDGRKLKINSIPKVVDSDCSISIPLNMESVTKTGDFTLSFTEINTLLQYYEVDFIDNYENELISVDSDFEYNYVINSDAESKVTDRFYLVLNNRHIDILAGLTDIDVCASSEVSYSLNNLNQNNNYTIYKGELKIKDLSNQSEASISIPDSLIQNSVNVFEVYGRVGTCDSVKVGSFKVNTVDSNINLDANVIGSNICPEATVGNFEINTESGVDYFILAGNDTIQTITGDGTLFTGTIESTYLSAGTNAFSIFAEKNECAYGSLNQKIEIIVDDFEIDQNIAFNSTNSCLKTSTDISFVSQSGVDYQIFKGTTLVNNVIGDGTEQTVEIPETNLTLGLNEFTIVAQHGECAEFIFPESIQIEVEENINTNLSLITENTCGDSNTAIVIENAQANKTYTLQSDGSDISSLTANSNGELTFSLNSNQVSTGLNELDIQIEGEICGAELSKNKAVFNVYEPINSNLVFVSTDVCNAAEATIGISNAQAGKIYKLYNGESLVESVTANTDGELIFANANNELVQGLNTFNLKIEGEGCGLVEVEQNLTITLFESIDPNLDIISPNTCTGDQVNIEITNPQAGKTYRLMASEKIMATEIASSEESLIFSLPSNNFGIGYHALTVDIIDDNCGTVTSNQTVEFELFDTAIISDIEDQNICKNESITIDLSANISMSNYQLFIGDELISEAASSTLSLSPTETTTYTLTGTPERGCGVNSVNFTIEVTDLATPGILVSNNVLESSVEGDSYQWYINGEILEGETGKVLVAKESGNYTVIVNKANCTKISDPYIFSEEVLNANKELANALKLYPNPVEDVLNIDMENINEVEVTIFTLSGRFMDIMNIDSKSKPSIDMSKFSEGIYLIQLRSGKGTITKKIIKK